MAIQISTSDLGDSNRIDSKLENHAQLENAIPGVYDSKISILGFRIQRTQNFDFNVFVQKSFKNRSKMIYFDSISLFLYNILII